MKVAIVHELLTTNGGAERVAKVLMDMFPQAPLYTLLYDAQKLGDRFPKERVRVSNLQKWTNLFGFNHHLYLPFFPAAVEAWDFSAFDLVISSSSAFAHGIITNGKPKHISYIHSPARYLWDRTHDIMHRQGNGPLGSLARTYLSILFHRLRVWDCEASDRADLLLAASREVQRRIELYWRHKSEVVYPPIEDGWFVENSTLRQRSGRELDTRDYFLVVSTLAPYKRIELAIEACNKTGSTLKIAGTGPAESRLKKIAGPTIAFLGFQNDEQLKQLYAGATATLFPGEEDFGLVPLESMACGTPVIAYRGGGALETVIAGETGAFFDEPTADSLAQTIQSFDHKKYSNDILRMHAKTFSRSEFEQKMRSIVAQVMDA